MTTSTDIRDQILQAGRRLEQHGMIAGSDGNISVRLGPNRVLITPAGLAKGRLSPDDLVVVDLEGRKLDGYRNPTSELSMHLFVYQSRADVNACVHAHPPYATAFAVVGRELPEDVLPEIVAFVGRVPLTQYAPPGTKAVADSLVQFVETHHAFLLRNHGLLTIGRTLAEAFNRHETVEHYARILWLAHQLGDYTRIPFEDFQRLTELRKKSQQGPAQSGPGAE